MSSLSYLNYYNIFDDFQAGAGVMDAELFTPEQERSFQPQVGGVGGVGVVGGVGSPINSNAFFSNLLKDYDVSTLLGLILFVIALKSTPIIALFMICVALPLMPLPCLVIAYCAAMQAVHPNASETVGMAVICVLVSIAVLAIRRSNLATSQAVTITTTCILLALFCGYTVRLSRDVTTPVCKQTGILPTFSDTY